LGGIIYLECLPGLNNTFNYKPSYQSLDARELHAQLNQPSCSIWQGTGIAQNLITGGPSKGVFESFMLTHLMTSAKNLAHKIKTDSCMQSCIVEESCPATFASCGIICAAQRDVCRTQCSCVGQPPLPVSKVVSAAKISEISSDLEICTACTDPDSRACKGAMTTLCVASMAVPFCKPCMDDAKSQSCDDGVQAYLAGCQAPAPTPLPAPTPVIIVPAPIAAPARPSRGAHTIHPRICVLSFLIDFGYLVF
jgi:hypothetical protein